LLLRCFLKYQENANNATQFRHYPEQFPHKYSNYTLVPGLTLISGFNISETVNFYEILSQQFYHFKQAYFSSDG